MAIYLNKKYCAYIHLIEGIETNDYWSMTSASCTKVCRFDPN